MKNTISIFCTLLLISVNSFGQNIVKSDASITAVDVYPLGAKLYMKSQAKLIKGQNRIEISNIPLAVYPQTLSAGFSIPGVTIHSSTFEKVKNPQTTDPQTIAANTQRQNVTNDNQLLALKIATIDEQIIVLKKQCNAKKDANTPLDYITGIVATLGTQMNKLQTERHELNQQINANNKIIEELNVKISERLKTLKNLSNRIIIIADATQDVVAPISAEYLVSNAAWSPYYEVRIDGNQCEVVTKAKVSQYTNLDWKNVKLTLISSNLQDNSAVLPLVTTQYIPVIMPRNQAKDYKLGAGQLSEAMAASSYLEMVEVTVNEDVSADYITNSSKSMAVEQGNLNMQNFQTTVPYTIANNSSAEIKLTQMNVPMTVEYLIMPTLSNSAYLVANLTTDGSFKNADANVYLDGTYIGTQNLSAVQLDADSVRLISKISLGTDNSITLKRNDKNYTKNNIQYFNRTSQIVNNKKESVAIKVVDSYPVSTNSDVKVENITLSDGSSTGNYQGVVNWVFTLAPAAKKEVNINYTVRDIRRR